MTILIYGKYTQARWDSLTDKQQLEAIQHYNFAEWRKAWKRQYALEVGMGVAGSQLQPVRG